MKSYNELLASRKVIIFDGATGSNLQTLELTADDFGGEALEGCNEILAVTRPDVIQNLHESFLAVGADVIETDTFGSISTVLAEYKIAARAYELNFKAAQIAKEVASGYSRSDKPRFVAGSMGPGTKLASLGQIRYKDLKDAYQVQAEGLIDGGVDLLLIETVFDLLSAKAAIAGARAAMAKAGRDLPLQVQVTIELTGRMLPGTEIGAALVALEPFEPIAIGINCATGPKEMGEHLRHLAANSPFAISCLPNAGLPSIVDSKMHYDVGPQELADYQSRFVTDLGVQIVGGCCGTTPDHIKAIVDSCANLELKERRVVLEPSVASLYSPVALSQDISYLAIGERTNANGSKRFREAMLAGDLDTCVDMAKEQTKDGAHMIDLCVDYTGADGVQDMELLASQLAVQSTIPIMLDSTEAEVIETGLSFLGGRPIINSVNLEEGSAPNTRLDKFLRLAKEYGSAVVCTCIDETGQARTAQWKLDAARAIYDIATKRYGLRPQDLLFDPLVLPISTGMEESRFDGKETIEGIKLIKENLPGVFTVVGLSNISFGLNTAAREVLNSVFLQECVEAGLDAAIVHPSKIVPLSSIPDEQIEVSLDLIYNRRKEGYDPLSRLIELFEGAESRSKIKIDLSSLPIRERLYRRIVDGNRVGLESDLTLALQEPISPLEIINGVLLDAMAEVGELFGSGKMQLPFVLSSAETMKAAVSFLEPYMEKVDQANKGTIVLATVKGDVHDIGKNLVDIILTNNGYVVHNLGIKVPLSEMVAKAKEVEADALGMSGLLVKSTLVMKENIEELNFLGLSHLPVILGGAALTRTFVEKDLRSIYKGRLFYGKDAFEGLRVMDRLNGIKSGSIVDDEFGRKLSERKLPPKRSTQMSEIDASPSVLRSESVPFDNPIFVPPFIGTEIVKGVALEEIASFLNETALFRNQWGFRPEKNESDPEFKSRIRKILRTELQKAIALQALIPQVVYGYFPVNSLGNELIVYGDKDRSEELTRFNFPRQKVEPYLSISDFFRPISSNEVDYAAFHVVSMGHRVSEITAELFSSNQYQDYLFLHGLGVEMTEALAELWHKRIRTELGFVEEDGPTLTGLFRQKYRGGRYSWGYPACPDLEDNSKVADLLGADRIGVTVSEGFQLHPEQTTTAIICHHPMAKYFVV